MEIVLENKELLRTVNKFLGIALIVLLCVFIYANVKSVSELKTLGALPETQENILTQAQTIGTLNEYAKVVGSRELFRPFIFKNQKTVKVKTIDDITRDLMLVGVVSVGQKEAIIKNRRTRHTYFVGEGGQLGELKILVISEDKIEVSYGQERKELFLW